VLGHSAPKIADKAQAGRLFCALPRGAAGTKMACGEDATTHFRQVNSTLCDIGAGIYLIWQVSEICFGANTLWPAWENGALIWVRNGYVR